MDNFEMYSMISCPKCGHAESEEIPEDHSLRFYACKQCNIVMPPKLGDCCVFCSYGSSPCLTVQKKQNNTDDLSGVITIRLTEKMLTPLSRHS
jgi:hypothetical protein